MLKGLFKSILALSFLLLMTTVSAEVQINQLDDLSFGIAPMDGSSISRNDNLCIYNNNLGSSYRITAIGNGPGGKFEMSDGVHKINYAVKWNDQPTTQGNQLLVAGVPLIMHNYSTSSNCIDSGVNANIEVIFSGMDLLQALANNYSGTITLVVEPN